MHWRRGKKPLPDRDREGYGDAIASQQPASSKISSTQPTPPIKTSLRKLRQKLTKHKAEKLISPCFGISSVKLFVPMAACILVCHFNLMPFGLSSLWLIPALAVLLAYFKKLKEKIDKSAAIGLVADPEVLALISREMPQWYSFKDIESVNWLNAVVQQLYPFIDEGMSAKLKNEVLPPLLDKVPGVSVECERISLGCVAPTITGVRCSHASMKGDVNGAVRSHVFIILISRRRHCLSVEVHLDIELKWNSDLYALLNVGFKWIPFSLELLNMSFSGEW